MTGRGRKTEGRMEQIDGSSSSDSDSSPMTQVPIRYAEPVAGPSGLCGFKRTANSGGAWEEKPKMVPTSSESDDETAHRFPPGGINWALAKRRRDTERLQRAPSRQQGVGHGRSHPDRLPKPNTTKALDTWWKAQKREEDGFHLKENAEDETSSDSQRLKTSQESSEDYWWEEWKGNGQFESDSDSDVIWEWF